LTISPLSWGTPKDISLLYFSMHLSKNSGVGTPKLSAAFLLVLKANSL
jgi:hypothetical protein